MRKRVRSIMFVVAGTFIAGFLLGEVWRLLASRRTDQHGYKPGIVGQVGRHEISLNEYNYNRSAVAQRYQLDSLFREMTPEDEARIDDEAWTNLTSDWIWAELMRKTKLRISEGELDWIMVHYPPEWLRNRPELMTDGQFDTAKYIQLLQHPENRQVFAQYARDIYKQLRSQKVQIYAASAYRPVTAEIEDALRQANSVVAVSWLYFSGRDEAEPTEAEARDYYRRHPHEFRVPKEIREVHFAYFPLRITGQDSLAARQRIEVAYARLRGAQDSASLRDSIDAAMFTDSDFLPETTSTRILRSALEPAVDSALSRLRPGQFSPVLPAPAGWQIVLLDSVHSDTYWVRRIRTRIRPDNAAEIAILDSIRSFIEIASNEGPESAAARTGTAFAPTPLVLVGGRLTQQFIQLYAPGQLEEWARRAKVGEVMPAPLRGPAGFYVFMLTSVKPAGVRPWDEQVKQAALWRVRQEKAKNAAVAKAREAITELRNGKTLEQYAAEHPEVMFGTDTVNGIWDYHMRGQRGVEFVGAALALTPGRTTGPVETRTGAYCIRCDGRTESQTLTAEEYTRQRQQQLAQAILQKLWEEHEVRDFRSPRGY